MNWRKNSSNGEPGGKFGICCWPFLSSTFSVVAMFTTAGFPRATRSAKQARWAMGGTVTGGLLSLAAIAPAARQPPPPDSTVVARTPAEQERLLRETVRLVMECH